MTSQLATIKVTLSSFRPRRKQKAESAGTIVINFHQSTYPPPKKKKKKKSVNET